MVNLGVGMPAAVGALAHQAGPRRLHADRGGGPHRRHAGRWPELLGASAYPEAVVDQPAQFDFYEGGGIDLAILGLAELDGHGNVNVEQVRRRRGAPIAGVGGFINITQSARALVFMGTLTAGGLRSAPRTTSCASCAKAASRRSCPRCRT